MSDMPVSFRKMLLRDYLAVQAPEMPQWWLSECISAGNRIEALDAAWRYYWADAMLKARERKPNAP